MILQLRRDKLQATAGLRYPDDEAAQLDYVTAVLNVAERHDEAHYWISDEAFASLRSDLGSRPRLGASTDSSNSGSQSVGLRGIASAAASIARTSVGIGRATDAQVRARLAVCRTCPDATPRGDPHTCGEIVRQTGKTCGCVVGTKARDAKQRCPQGRRAAI